MRSASTAFAEVVARSHQVATRVDVLFGNEVIAEGLPILDGQISYDRRAEHLASLSCTIADPLRIPTGPDDILTPYGYELQVWRGVVLPTGPELVAMGTFPIQYSFVDTTMLTQITAVDRSQFVTDARFEDTYQIAAATNYATAIEALLLDAVPWLECLFPSIVHTTPLLTFDAQEDRWAAAQRMARSIGHEIFFDGLGRCVMRPEPTFADSPVASIAESANMVAASVALDRRPAYNRVIAVSVNAANGAVYRGVATDDDPQSPTFYDGPFGHKPRFYASEFIASTDQAASAAAAILASGLGVAKSIDFAAVPDPRLECSDVERITNSTLGVDALHIIESLTIGIGPEAAMSGTSRAQEGVVTVE